MTAHLRFAAAAAAAALVAGFSGCALDGGSPSGADVGGGTGGPVCDDLPFAGQMREAMASDAALLGLNIDGEPGADIPLQVVCGVLGPDKAGGLSVAYEIETEACVTGDVVSQLDPDYPGGFYATAANGGISYRLCSDTGATLSATYISVTDVPAPTFEQVREFAIAALENEQLLHDIARAAVDMQIDVEPEGDGECEPIPDVLVIGGTVPEVCIIEVYSSDVGVVSVVRSDSEDTYSQLGEALEAAGLETVFCSDEAEGRYCGWNGEYGNVNQIEIAAGDDDNRWGVDVILLDVEAF
jgi:hypothetical protein